MDHLFGDRGDDDLDGGNDGDRDFCHGGPGAGDTATKCDKQVQIP